MASLGTLMNTGLWTSYKIYSGLYWILWGTPESIETKLMKQTNKRLDNLEQKINQIWAIETGMTSDEYLNPNLMKSIIITDSIDKWVDVDSSITPD